MSRSSPSTTLIQSTSHPTHAASSFLVAIPREVQKAVDKATLPIKAGTLDAVSPYQVRLGLTTEMETPASMGATLEAFDLSLYNGDTPGRPAFLTVSVPQQSLKGKTEIVIPSQVVTVQDHAELVTFLTRTFANEKTTVGCRGDSVARVAGQGYPVHFDKPEVALDGLAGLDGMHITELVPEVGGAVNGGLFVPNRSPLALGLGNVTYNVVSGGETIGKTTILDLHVVPGNQNIEYQGQLSIDDIVAPGVLEAVVRTIDDTKEENPLEFVVTGDQSTVNGERIGYLDAILSNIQVKAQVPFCQAFWAIPRDVRMAQPFDRMDFMLTSTC